MSNKKMITCIVCPSGCQMEVWEEEGEIKVTGNSCKRGYEYALEEYKAPKRILTTTIRVKNGILPVIPVRSNVPILKEKLFDSMAVVNKTITEAPIKMGDVLIKKILGLEVDIIASRDLEEK
ncbi:MAG: DUF1667 domain-containing protein [Candidatus Helarchaeota archaeon]